MADSDAGQVLAYLQRAGLPGPAALGVVGNLVAESHLDTRPRTGDGGLASGIAQWHPDRWANLESFAKQHNADPSALNTQVAFAVEEAKGIKPRKGGPSLWDQLRNTTDALTASKLWMRQFERPADQSDQAAQDRLNAGTKALRAQQKTGSLSDLGGALKSAGKAGADAVGGLFQWPADVVGGISALGDAAKSAGSFFDHLLWWFNPNHQLRVVIGFVSVLMILLGLYLLSREVKA